MLRRDEPQPVGGHLQHRHAGARLLRTGHYVTDLEQAYRTNKNEAVYDASYSTGLYSRNPRFDTLVVMRSLSYTSTGTAARNIPSDPYMALRGLQPHMHALRQTGEQKLRVICLESMYCV